MTSAATAPSAMRCTEPVRRAMAKRTPMPSKTKCRMRGGVILFLCMTHRPRACVPTQTR